jgi:hypothetical protein
LKKYEVLALGGVFTGANIDWSRDILFVNVNCPTPQVLEKLSDIKFLDKCCRIAFGREFFYEFAFEYPTGQKQSKYLPLFSKIQEILIILDLEEQRVVKRNGPIVKHGQQMESFIFATSSEEVPKFEITKTHLHHAVACNENILNGSLVTMLKTGDKSLVS